MFALNFLARRSPTGKGHDFALSVIFQEFCKETCIRVSRGESILRKIKLFSKWLKEKI